MKWRRLDPETMPWYYYLVVIVAVLVITYIGLSLAGEVDNPIEFLLNLKKRHLQV